MAIDPNIALGIRVPQQQQDSPLALYAQALQLKHLMKSGRAQDLEVQQVEQAIADDKAARELFARNPNPKPEDVFSAVGPRAGAPLVKSMRDQETADLAHKQKALEFSMKQIERVDQLAGLATPENYGAILDTARKELPPEIVGSLPPTFPGAQAIDTFRRSILPVKERAALEHQSLTERLAQDAATRAAEEHAATLPGKTADSAQKQIVSGQVEQLGMTKAEKERIDAQKLTADQTAKHQAELERQGKIRLGFEGQRVGLERQRFNSTLGAGLDANGQPLPPDAMKAKAATNPAAQAIAEYRMRPPQQRSGQVPPVMREVLALNPGYDATKFDARNRMMTAYTSGRPSQEINAANTALGHLDTLNSAIDALNNGDIRVLNALGNRIGVETGKDAVTTFNAIVHRVGPEVVKAYAGTAGGQEERKVTESDFNPNAGPKQLRSNVAVTAKLFRSKLQPLENQWKQTMGSGDFEQRFITPEASQFLQKVAPSGGGGTVKLKAPNGDVSDVPADQVDYYLKLGAKRL